MELKSTFARFIAPALLLGTALLGLTGQPLAQTSNEVVVNPKAHKPQVATPKKPPRDAPRFELAAKINMSQGLIREVAWLSDKAFIALVMRPDGAQVLQFDYDTLRREKFLSADFISKHMTGAAQADRLTWTVSPSRKYIFFSWFLDNGERRWKLVDISEPPNFRLRSFTPPEGMQIERALFSPDDRYLAFFHDSNIEGSPVSILVLDLKAGKELWRVGSAEVGFIKDAWWDGAVFDAPRFQATAAVHNGQFLERPGLATLALQGRNLKWSENVDGVVTGASGLWGQALALKSQAGAQSPYFLLVSRDGSGRDTLPLTNVPDDIQLLSDPGLLLLSNVDRKSNVGELWLIDADENTKFLVDGDVGGYALSGTGRLIVRGEQSNDLRIYDFTNPRRPAGESPAQSLSDPNRDPDAWVPH